MFSRKFQNRFFVISIILCIFGSVKTNFDSDPIPGVPKVETEDTATYGSEEEECASSHSYDPFSRTYSFQSVLPKENINRHFPDLLGRSSVLNGIDTAELRQMERSMEIMRRKAEGLRDLGQRLLSTPPELSVGKTIQSPPVSQDGPEIEVMEPDETPLQKEDDND